jgi:hypothetical protein
MVFANEQAIAEREPRFAGMGRALVTASVPQSAG